MQKNFRLHQDDHIHACEKKVSQNEVANKTMANNRIFKTTVFSHLTFQDVAPGVCNIDKYD